MLGRSTRSVVKCLQTLQKFQNSCGFHNFRANVRSVLWQPGYNLGNDFSDAKVFMTNWGNQRFVMLLVGHSLCGMISCYMRFAVSTHHPSAVFVSKSWGWVPWGLIRFKAFSNWLIVDSLYRAYSVALAPAQWKSCHQASKAALLSPDVQCQRELGKLMSDGWSFLSVGGQSCQSYGTLEEKACGSCPAAACWCLFSLQSFFLRLWSIHLLQNLNFVGRFLSASWLHCGFHPAVTLSVQLYLGCFQSNSALSALARPSQASLNNLSGHQCFKYRNKICQSQPVTVTWV